MTALGATVNGNVFVRTESCNRHARTLKCPKDPFSYL
jgi:hypothetical protein